MLDAIQVEEIVATATAMDRPTLIAQIQQFRASFPVDFTRDYLEQQSTEQLQHLFLALCLQSQRMPELPAAAA